MTQSHGGSFSAVVCTEVDPRRCSLVRTSIPNDSNVLPYRHPSNSSDRYLLPSLETTAPVVQSFTCGPDFTDPDYCGEFFSLADSSRYAYYPQHDYFHGFSGTQMQQSRQSLQMDTLPEMSQQSRPSLQMNPFTSGMEMYLPYQQGAYPTHMQPHFIPPTYSMGMGSDTTSIPPPSLITPDMMSFRSAHDAYYTTPLWQQKLAAFPTQEYDQTTSTDDGMEGTDGLDEFDEDEAGNFDKPYAQLIYEALMQAPGHRMLLRDIYEWFQNNTRKPRESGTNGWQNSIRHNLSMNQAFENDKNDPTISRGTKKANSMWVLTDHAIKHGVQSTTRYRKNGNTKKTSGNRTPAIQRQRSGAKGGRAARRAARAKRNDYQAQAVRSHYNGLDSPASYSHTPSPLSTSRDQWSAYGDSPITPSEESFPSISYSLPHRSYCDFDPQGGLKMGDELYDEDHFRQLLSAPSERTTGSASQCEKQD